MALKIIKSADPILVEHINLCVYAPPGVGKTTLAFTAESPLLLDFDKGVHRAGNRKDTVQPGAWNEVEMTAEELAPYKTIVIDTAGRALDFLSADIIKANPKAGRSDGSLTLQGFGTLKARFGTWMRTLKTFGKDVVLIAHMDEQRSGDDIVERLDVQGGSKGEIYKSVDAMGRIFIRDKKRVIDFSPRENSFGKNPAGLEVLDIPDVAKNGHFLADVIQTIKAKMNTQAEEQQKELRAVEEWAEVIAQMTEPEDFNRNLQHVKQTGKPIQSLFAERARILGLTFNKQAGVYEYHSVFSI